MAAGAISVVTVVLDDADGLLRTANSLQEQYIKAEWIVIDGGSSDRTLEVLEALGSRVIWTSERDEGIYDAMNKGVRRASGDYVVFMNAGDVFFDKGTLQRVVEKLGAARSPVDMLCGGAILAFPRGREIYRPPKDIDNYIWHGLPSIHQATFYRSFLLKEVPYDLRYVICGDYYLAAVLYLKGANMAYLDVPLAKFSIGGASYLRRRKLFMEPYWIQRDLLMMPLAMRLLSMAKRLIATIGFVLLANDFGLAWLRVSGA